MNGDMIKVENITKRFDLLTAVDNISFRVKEGEILGFLGPNGAGKSTTMRMITGFLSPTEGEITVSGYNTKQEPQKIKSLIGYLPESSPVYKDMTPYSFLKFVASVRDIHRKALRKALERTIALCGLEGVLFQSIDTLSRGYLQRVCLAQAIIHDPPILILDEPTDGLDPNQKHQTRELIKKMRKNKTIIISTHILEEVDACCTRAMIISKGRIVADSTPIELKSRSDTANTLALEISEFESGHIIKEQLKTLHHLSKISVLTESKHKISLRLYPDKASNITFLTAKATRLIQGKNWKINDITIDKGNLGEVFRKITSN
jgi:ABC-2 type transport system ATP-binding protein